MRIVTRGDLDGLVSSVLLSQVEDIKDITLIHPQDITDHKFPVEPRDILVNVPFDPRCALWFDHHAHTVMPGPGGYKGAHGMAPSVARVVFDHYGGASRFPQYEAMVEATDRFDSANLMREDILDPKGTILLGFLIDPRTGLNTDFKLFFPDLVERLREKGVDSLLKDTDLSVRVAVYRKNMTDFLSAIRAHSEVDSNVVVTDFRPLVKPPIGNRFLVYTAFPQCNVSLRVSWGPGHEFVAVNIGHSILDRSCPVDVGALCREYGGGGHRGAGACVLSPEMADLEIHDLIERLVDH
jgi:hypothetical protein